MAGLHPPRKDGRVNGLQGPTGPRGRSFRLARRYPLSLIVAGLGLYLVALIFPVALRQVSSEVVAGAVAGTALLIAGLHVRWTQPVDARH